MHKNSNHPTNSRNTLRLAASSRGADHRFSWSAWLRSSPFRRLQESSRHTKKQKLSSTLFSLYPSCVTDSYLRSSALICGLVFCSRCGNTRGPQINADERSWRHEPKVIFCSSAFAAADSVGRKSSRSSTERPRRKLVPPLTPVRLVARTSSLRCRRTLCRVTIVFCGLPGCKAAVRGA
jgi:hypothetical protein